MAITYSIDGGADAAKFNINATSGALTFKTAPDFEAPGDANGDNVYEVSVKAADAGGLSTSKLVKVTVTDVSEGSPPQITSAGAVTVKENSTTVMTVTATDPDDTTQPPIEPPITPPATGDGSDAAPAGPAQFPHLLDVNSASTQTYGKTYVTRPAWKVAGVDYAVGIDRTKFPTNANLKKPNTITSGGNIIVNGTRVTVTGNGGVLEGYDMTGWAVTMSGTNGVVRNCFFKPTSGSAVYTSGIGNMIEKCEFDGKSQTDIGSALINPNGANNTVQYCYIHDAFAIGIVVASNQAQGFNLTYKYNVFKDICWGYNQGAHGDWIQQYNGANGVIDSLVLSYNLALQAMPMSQGRTQGFSIASANIKQGPIKGYECCNNTMISNDGAYVNWAIVTDNGNVDGVAKINNNYVDTAGMEAWLLFAAYNGSGAGHGPYNGSYTATGNKNLRTNANLT